MDYLPLMRMAEDRTEWRRTQDLPNGRIPKKRRRGLICSN